MIKAEEIINSFEKELIEKSRVLNLHDGVSHGRSNNLTGGGVEGFGEETFLCVPEGLEEQAEKEFNAYDCCHAHRYSGAYEYPPAYVRRFFISY